HMVKDRPKPAEGKPGAKPAKATPAATNAKPGPTAGPPGSDDSSRISRLDAQGNVLVSTDTDIGRSDYGVYNAETGIATLLGNVTLTRGPNAIRGQYAVVDLNNNISRLMPAPATPGAPAPRVEGLFVRQDTGAALPGEAKPASHPTAKSAPKQ
ncbi:MAG: hypothetical protein J2P48_13760, partial [Alphaproteobacteria bacterium]|nr:hypothetical protein [Alphaproteobacteria bacterium]